MFDNLRADADANPSKDIGSGAELTPALDMAPAPPPAAGRLLGLTAPQRLIVAIMLMIAVCVLGTMCLLVTGRIGAI